MLGRKRNVDVHGFANGLAVVERFDGCKALLVGVNDVGNFVQDGAALGNGGVFPRGERTPRSFHGAVDVFFGGFGNVSQVLAGGGVCGFKGCAVGRRNKFSVDKQVICIFQLCIHDKLLTIKVRVKRCASVRGCKLAVCELHLARVQPCDGARCSLRSASVRCLKRPRGLQCFLHVKRSASSLRLHRIANLIWNKVPELFYF